MRRTGKFVVAIALVANSVGSTGVGVALASAPSPQTNMRSMPLVPPLPDECVLPNVRDRNDRVRVGRQFSPAPAPPPPPPPPPPPRAPQANGSNERVVVTGTRIATQDFESNSPITTVDQSFLARGSSANNDAAESVTPPNGEVLTQPAERESRYAHFPIIHVPMQPNQEQYAGEDVSPVHMTMQEPVSTFSVDVDTAAYANARRFLTMGQLPPQDAVRTEELINYFRYDYPLPEDSDAPFSVTTDMAVTPWNPETRLLRVGLRGYDLDRDNRPAANLVFLLDVSGSMGSADKLPLVQTAMRMLSNELQEQDRVSIVVYAGAAGLVLEPTNDECQIRIAIESLRAGGSTAGGAGIQLAYNVARGSFIEDGVNRVILATDGDFNVGIRDRGQLIEMIEEQRESGITLTTLGFGSGNLNDAMMEQIADHGNGNYAYIDTAMEARKVLSEEMESTLFTIAHDVKIQVEFNPALVSQYRLIGYENRALREEDFDNDAIDAGEIGAGHQVTALYEIVPTGGDGWVRPRRYQDQPEIPQNRTDEMAFVQLRYKLPGEDTSRLIQRPLNARMLRQARAAQGDLAFAAAVAAYGQRLRGDSLLNGFDAGDAATLAGDQDGYWREEFLQLAGLADSLDGR